jgi:hypothetical protein
MKIIKYILKLLTSIIMKIIKYILKLLINIIMLSLFGDGLFLLAHLTPIGVVEQDFEESLIENDIYNNFIEFMQYYIENKDKIDTDGANRVINIDDLKTTNQSLYEQLNESIEDIVVTHEMESDLDTMINSDIEGPVAMQPVLDLLDLYNNTPEEINDNQELEIYETLSSSGNDNNET